MRSLMGLLWALGGAVAGGVVGAAAAMLLVKLTNTSNREGAQGYVLIALALLGAVVGIAIGLTLYARSAPAGQGVAFFGSGTSAVIGVVALVALGVWASMYFRESPAMYGGAQATLELEFRVKTNNLPPDFEGHRFNVEVQTAKTRPEASVSWSSRRVEGEYTIIPAFQGPLYRASDRFIVVRMSGLHDEMFLPSMKRTPPATVQWSAWSAPASVDPTSGAASTTPLVAILEMRYRVRPYGSTN